MSAWAIVLISALVGLVGIMSGLAGQALYWGRFEGRIITRVDTTESDVAELKASRTQTYNRINEHGERIAALESACKINHQVKVL